MQMIDTLILEDRYDHWENLTDILKNLGLSYYPNEQDEFDNLQKALIQFSLNNNDQTFSRIVDNINKYHYRHYFLDINMQENSSLDQSGFKLRNRLISLPEFEKMDYTVLTSYSDTGQFQEHRIPTNKYIYKDAKKSVIKEAVMMKVIKKYFADRIPNSLVDKTKTANYKTEIPSSSKFETTKFSRSVKWLGEKISRLYTKLNVYYRYQIDSVIGFLFYMFIKILFYAAIAIIGFKCATIYYHEITNENSLIRISEYTFLAFLPLIAIFGFLSFFEKAIKPYLDGSSISFFSINYEDAAELMEVCKKMFIGSLISYLIVKLIDLLFIDTKIVEVTGINKLDMNTKTIKTFTEVYKISPIYLFVIMGCTIIMLTIYFLLLNKHKSKIDRA